MYLSGMLGLGSAAEDDNHTGTINCTMPYIAVKV